MHGNNVRVRESSEIHKYYICSFSLRGVYNGDVVLEQKMRSLRDKNLDTKYIVKGIMEALKKIQNVCREI